MKRCVVCVWFENHCLATAILDIIFIYLDNGDRIALHVYIISMFIIIKNQKTNVKWNEDIDDKRLKLGILTLPLVKAPMKFKVTETIYKRNDLKKYNSLRFRLEK